MKHLFVLALALLAGSAAWAHPVAQGQIEIQWQQDSVQLTARISNEQIMVASMSISSADADTIEEIWADHGRYLLAHLKVGANDQLLQGTVLGVARSGNEFVEYRLRYPLPAATRELRLQQDLLNEIEYAPGNPWEATYVVQVTGSAGSSPTLLRSHNAAVHVARINASGPGALAREFLTHGFQHILGGYDHLLFVTALVLAAVGLRNLIMVIAAFTLAHSITLALSALQLVRLPSSVAEPMIAGSIVAVALANIFWPRSGGGWLRMSTAFFFGLFHGLGFAGGLLEVAQAMSGTDFVIAIAAFSAGVECGHLLVVIPLFFALLALRRWLAAGATDSRHALLTLRGGSALICLAGIFYLGTALQL